MKNTVQRTACAGASTKPSGLKQLSILAVGFARRAQVVLSENTRGHKVHQVRGLTEARHQITDKKFHVVILNADSLSNKQILAACQLQGGRGTHVVAIHGDGCKRKPPSAPKDRSVIFMPMGGIADHLPAIMTAHAVTNNKEVYAT